MILGVWLLSGTTLSSSRIVCWIRVIDLWHRIRVFNSPSASCRERVCERRKAVWSMFQGKLGLVNLCVELWQWLNRIVSQGSSAFQAKRQPKASEKYIAVAAQRRGNWWGFEKKSWDIHDLGLSCRLLFLDHVEWEKGAWTKTRKKSLFKMDNVELPCTLHWVRPQPFDIKGISVFKKRSTRRQSDRSQLSMCFWMFDVQLSFGPGSPLF